MENPLYRSALFTAYQFTLLLAIVMLPVALVMRQVGVTLPLHRMVTRLADAYEGATPDAA